MTPGHFASSLHCEMEYSQFLHEWLDRHPPAPKEEKDLHEAERRADQAEERRVLLRIEPQEKLDLHGLTIDEAVARTDLFLRSSSDDGLRKVLIVHGKGNHSTAGQPVLKSAIRDFVRRHPLCAEMGVPDRGLGGEGAIWVILRRGTIARDR